MKPLPPEEIGALNPDAPAELAKFAFLIGTWRGEGRSMNQDGSTDTYQMSWVGRYVMGGHAIADEARVFDEEGGLTAHFITHRFYDRTADRWYIEAFNVLASTTVRQAPDDLGGVQSGDGSITLMTHWPPALGRESFLNIHHDHFTYCCDISMDGGQSWVDEWDMIEARRVPD